MNIIIRQANILDIDGIAETHVRSFQEGHRDFMPEESLAKVNNDDLKHRWQNRLVQPNSHTFVAEDKQKIVGLVYLTICPKRAENGISAEFLYFYIDPGYWRKGIGTLLWKAIRNFLLKEKIPLAFGWVLKSNPKSRAFYESFGAKPDGVEQTVEKLGTTLVQIRYILKIEQS